MLFKKKVNFALQANHTKHIRSGFASHDNWFLFSLSADEDVFLVMRCKLMDEEIFIYKLTNVV